MYLSQRQNVQEVSIAIYFLHSRILCKRRCKYINLFEISSTNNSIALTTFNEISKGLSPCNKKILRCNNLDMYGDRIEIKVISHFSQKRRPYTF